MFVSGFPGFGDVAPQSFPKGEVFKVTPTKLGLGQDCILGAPGCPHYSVIDLSALTAPVTIEWSGRDSGFITDGADTIIFQRVDQIIPPRCMQDARAA